MGGKGGRYESQRQWCTVRCPCVRSSGAPTRMHRCAVGAKDGRAHEIVVISWALRWCVLGGVLLSRTLAGAVPSALSGLASGFGMDAGRFPVAVTTETTRWAVRDDRRLWCGYSVIRMAAYPHTLCVVGGWVGCGPYSGRFALLWLLTPGLHAVRVCRVWGVVVCVGLLVPVSSNRYRSSTSGLSTQ